MIHDEDFALLGKLLWIIFLGFPLFVSARLLLERKQWEKKAYSLLIGGCFLFLVGYYFLLPPDIFESSEYMFRSLLWGMGFTLLITFIPFLDKEAQSSLRFWNFNKKLLLIVLQAGFFALTIYLGITAALLSVTELFNLDIGEKRYAELFVICSTVIVPFLFLYNVPADPQENLKKEYPKGLRIFAQYILLPLVVLYFVILYAYTAKVVLTWEWPKGVLSYMIASFSFVGVALHFFVYPRLKKEGWLSIFIEVFYLILLPQLVMYFMAIWMRVNQYGITENRYFVIIGGVWLLGIALYFLLSKKRDIRVISVSLFLVLLFSSFGPWGAFSVAERSQVNRLEALLQKNNLFDENGMAKKAEEEVSYEDAKEISSIVRYLYQHHDFDAIQPWFEQDLNKSGASNIKIEENVVDLLGVKYIDYWESWDSESEEEYFSFRAESSEGFSIEGFDYLVPLSASEKIYMEIDGATYLFFLGDKGDTLFIVEGNNVWVILLEDYLDEVFRTVEDDTLVNEGGGFEHEIAVMNFRIRFDSIYGHLNKKDGTRRINSLRGTLFLKMKN